MTGRWIIPAYDVVFVAPGIMILASATAAIGFANWNVPIEISGPIISALVAFIAWQTPPGLNRWRLTDEHRIVHLGASTVELTGVGSSKPSS